MILVFRLLNWPFPVTQLGKNLPAVRETWVKSLNWEDPLEKGKTKSIYSWLCISRLKYNTVAVQLLSRVRLFAAPRTAIRQASLYFTISESSLTLISIGLMMPSTISSSLAPFSYSQSFPASGSFQMNQLFASGGQNIGDSASASALPVNIQG